MSLSITEIHQLARVAPYNDEGKKKWLKEARKKLKWLADAIPLHSSNYNIHANPAGIAIPGDVTLHHERIYVMFTGGFQYDIGYARTCEGRKDFTGGQNHFIGIGMSDDQVRELCLSLLERKSPFFDQREKE